MNTQALKIARAMGLIIDNRIGTIYYRINIGRESEENIDFWKEWNPAENPEQLQMIEDWVVEQGYIITMGRSKDVTWYIIEKEMDTGMQINNKSKPLAFLQAVEQLIDNLKEKE